MMIFLSSSIRVYVPYLAQWPGLSARPSPPQTMSPGSACKQPLLPLAPNPADSVLQDALLVPQVRPRAGVCDAHVAEDEQRFRSCRTGKQNGGRQQNVSSRDRAEVGLAIPNQSSGIGDRTGQQSPWSRSLACRQ